MDYKEGKDKFIQSWGALGSNWGINRTMAQIHALLLISPVALSTEEIMEELKISRGNANMNVRALIDWGVVHKEYKTGERREFFRSEKDVWHLAARITRERRRRELEPLRDVIIELKQVKGKETEELKEFQRMVKDIDRFAEKADGLLDKLVKMDQNWFFSTMIKLMK